MRLLYAIFLGNYHPLRDSIEEAACRFSATILPLDLTKTRTATVVRRTCLLGSISMHSTGPRRSRAAVELLSASARWSRSCFYFRWFTCSFTSISSVIGSESGQYHCNRSCKAGKIFTDSPFLLPLPDLHASFPGTASRARRSGPPGTQATRSSPRAPRARGACQKKQKSLAQHSESAPTSCAQLCFRFPADINKPLRSTKHVLANALNSASASRRVCNNSRDNTEGPSNQVILWKGSWHAHTCIESPRSRSIASTSIQPNLALRLHSATLRPQVKRHKHV